METVSTEGAAGILLILVLVYFLPVAIAITRRHPNGIAIFLINLLFGWTFIGWFIALIWAVKAIDRPQVVYVEAEPEPDRKASLSFTLAPDLYDRVSALAVRLGVPMAEIGRQAVAEFLDRRERPAPAEEEPAPSVTATGLSASDEDRA